MDSDPHEDRVKEDEHTDELLTRIREFFDKKGYVRVRVRKRGSKTSKVRNLRALTSDPKFAQEVKVFLKKAGVNASSYPIGKSICIDIEGNHKLETLLKVVGLNEEKKKQLLEALKPLSLTVLRK